MKTSVRFSRLQGKADDKKFHSVAEFCRIVANDCTTDVYGYFTNFYAAFIADSLQEKKRTEESQNDFIKRVMNKAFQTAKSTPTKELKETELYKTFSSKNQLFKLIRTIMPAFYDEERKHRFAKVQKVAFNTSKLTKEKINDLVNAGYRVLSLDIPADTNKNFPKGKKVEICTKVQRFDQNGSFSETETKGYFYNLLDATRKQRKEKFADMKESTIFFFDTNDHICTLVEHDKMNFETLYTYISEYAQVRNFEKVANQQEKEKRTKTQLSLLKGKKELDKKVSKAFNDLLSFRNKVAKENDFQYIADENKRNLVLAGFIKHTTEYKAACQKRFDEWKESENPFLQDTAKILQILTSKPKKDAKAASAKKGSTKAASTKKGSTKVASEQQENQKAN